MIVGLTGGIGSGKTVVSDHFNFLGVPIIDTDIIARNIVQIGSPTLNKLVNAFGKSILHKDGALNRNALRKAAFSSSEQKNQLDNITHPAIYNEALKQINTIVYDYCIVVVPLLIGADGTESKFIELMDTILVVTAPKQIKIERIKQRNGLTEQEIERIMQNQIDDQSRLKYAQQVINNDSDITSVQQHVEQLHADYLITAKTKNDHNETT